MVLTVLFFFIYLYIDQQYFFLAKKQTQIIKMTSAMILKVFLIRFLFKKKICSKAIDFIFYKAFVYNKLQQ